MFQRLKVSTRLIAAFGTLAVLAMVLSGYGLHSMASVEDQLVSIVDVNNPEGAWADTMRVSVSEAGSLDRNLALLSDEKAMAVEHAHLKAALADYDRAETALDKLFALPETTERERHAMAALKLQKAKALPVIEQAAALGLANHNEEAAKVLINVLQPIQQAWLDQLTALVKLEAELNGDAGREAHATYARSKWIFLALTAAAGLIAVVLTAWVTRGLTRQLGAEPSDLADLAGAMAQGDLSRPIALKGAHPSSVVCAMATMQQALRQVVGEVRSSSDSIATGASQIATGNSDLSQRTQEQAGSVEETAASMEQIGSTVKNSAEAAAQASELARVTSGAVLEGGAAVQRVVATMTDISTSSRRMSDIIGTIDGIAFQTNILALNAAVEAARAGEQGRGFAVVASEVRSLAQRSAQAAREIKGLIDASVADVSSGTQQVSAAGETMKGIVERVDRMSQFVSEISRATREQSLGLAQVGTAMQQIDRISQQNSALVEQSAAAASSLQTQAEKLVRAVGIFQLGH
ncbi:MAG: methyl-accepting chemotaxis protein [Pseudomonadota bacterium]|nr:methyl-accepting chemotaxis protein [Pseudomonadota bacterium]